MKVLVIVAMLAGVTATSAYAASLWDVLEAGTKAGDTLVFAFDDYDAASTYIDLGLAYGNYNINGSDVTGDGSSLNPWLLPDLTATGAPASSGWDSWGLLWLKTIYNETTNAYVFDTSGVLDGRGNMSIQAYGLFWGETDTSLQISAGTGGNTGKDEYYATGNDMQFAMFEHGYAGSTPFAAWQSIADDGTGVLGGTATQPTYAGVTDGSLFLSGSSVPWFGREFWSQYYVNPSTGAFSGNSGFYADDPDSGNGWGPGSSQEEWGGLPLNGYKFDLGQNFSGPSTVGPPGSKWGASSSDPARAVVTPELSSSALMLLGFVPIGLGWWRRRKA
jgi:hypothetical protein